MHVRPISVVLALAGVIALQASPVRGQQQAAPRPSLAVTQREGAPVGATPGSVLPSAQAVPPQPALPAAPVLQLDERQIDPRLDGTRFSLTFTEPRPVVEIFRLFFGAGGPAEGMSFVPAPALDQTFIGELNNVSVREALDLITQATGLDYSVQGNVVRLFVRDLETRFYSIDRVITQRNGSRSMSATTGTGTGAGGAAISGTTVAASTGVAGTNMTTGNAGGGGSSSSVGGTDTPDLFGDLVDGVEALIAGDEGASVTLNRTAAVLQVTARQSRLQRVEQYLDAVMSRALRQVQIEARVIEVELTEDFSAGINWSLILGGLQNSASLTQELAPATSGGFTLGLKINDFTALLNAFATQGKVNVLSSPRLTALNNEPAVMRIGRQNTFFTTTTQTNEFGQILQTASIPQSITEGVVLSMTAQVSADNVINMSINPSITENAGVATSRFGDTVPIINVRETDTLVRVREGETIVIAGLMHDRTNSTQGRVPVLGGLPLVGGAFRREERTRVKTDLVILLTPTIMSPAATAGATARELRRLDAAQTAQEQSR